MPVTIIHERMRPCMLKLDGEVNYYLDRYNKQGVSPSVSGLAQAGTSGLTLKGGFTNASVGQYVKNVDTDYYHKILTKPDNNTVTLHYALDSAQKNWGKATDTVASKLVDTSADFIEANITVGMIVAKRDLSDYAVITGIDSATQLSLSKDIFAVNNPYTIMTAFVEGQEYQVQTAIFNGDDGYGMVEMPKYYHKYAFANGKHSNLISPTPLDGYIMMKTFQRPDGTERDFIYYPMFEGVIDDAGFADGKVLTSYNLAEDVLKSLPGLRPVVNGQRSEFRSVCDNNNGMGITGWHQLDWHTHWALQLLMMVEMESMNSQAALGAGMTEWSSAQRDDFVVNTANRAVVHTGYSLREGANNANVKTEAANAGGYLSYRGIENPYGHIWKFLDGINIQDGRVYLANDHANFADDSKASPYIDTGFTQPSNSGYISKVHPSRLGLFVKESGGSGSTYLPDYYWFGSGWRVALAGGVVAGGALAGFAALNANDAASARHSGFGSRVCFRR